MERVPLDDRGGELDGQVRRGSEDVVSIGPWPFRRDALDISILARRVPRRVYSDAKNFQQALADASYFAINFSLRAAPDQAFGRRNSAVA